MTLTKAELTDSICSQVGLSKSKSIQVLESLLQILKRTMENGEDVLVSGFGKFCAKEQGKRRGGNRQTGEDVILDERRVVTFECSRRLRDAINEG